MEGGFGRSGREPNARTMQGLLRKAFLFRRYDIRRMTNAWASAAVCPVFKERGVARMGGGC